MTDPGELFLQGYFGQAKIQQDKMNRADAAQQFAQDMAQKQQQFQLQQQRLAEEIKQHAAEGDWRQAETKHQQLQDSKVAAASDWSKTLEGFDRQTSGSATPVASSDLKYSGPTVPVGGGPSGLPAMQIPASRQFQTAQGADAVNFGGGQILRPTSPQERAQAVFSQSQAQDDIVAQAKSQRAMSNVNDMVKAFPDSDLAKDGDFRQQTYSHMAFGTPMEKNPTWDNFETKETSNWLQSQDSSDPTVRAAGQKRWNTAFPIIHKINTDRAGVGAAIGANEKEKEIARISNDTAEVQGRAEDLLPKGGGSDADRNNAVSAAFSQINKERKLKGQPALHPDALKTTMGAETKGIPVSPKTNFNLQDVLDRMNKKNQPVVSRPPSQ